MMRYRRAVAGYLAAALILPATRAAAADALDSVPFDLNSPKVQAEARKLDALPAVKPPAGHRLVNDRTGRRQAGPGKDPPGP